MTPTEAAWLGGFLDGEGCFHTPALGRGICISISNTHLPTLRRIQRLVGVGSVTVHSSPKTKSRQAYKYQVYGENACRLIEATSPYLYEKQAQAQLLARWRATPPKSDERVRIIAEIKRLKRIEHGIEDSTN